MWELDVYDDEDGGSTGSEIIEQLFQAVHHVNRRRAGNTILPDATTFSLALELFLSWLQYITYRSSFPIYES